LPATTVLRALVVTEVVLLAASILTVFLPSETPSAIDEYLEGPGAGLLFRDFDADPAAATYMFGAFPFLGSSLVDPISGTVDYLGAVCSGAILATLFSSEVKVVFEVQRQLSR
jgi:hypothetical protein